jgi:leucyl aminopeptidase (aminopeptidase T)
MRDAAAAAVDCLGVGDRDDVLVLCNAGQRAIADALAEAAGAQARDTRVLEFPAATRHGEEPPAHVVAAMAGATVVFAPTAFSISHTRARVGATERGVRIATMPGITEETFRRAVPVAYGELKRAGEDVAARLTAAARCRVTSPGGTDVVVDLEGRTGINDDGDLAAPGAFGNLPAGEAFIAPIETTGDGTILFDGAIGGYGLLDEPVRVTLAGGRLVAAEGGAAARWLIETLDAGGEHGRSIAELGIGTNPAARLIGSIIEDEKVKGTAHIAFGTSAGIGGVNVASVHIDGMVLDPQFDFDQ